MAHRSLISPVADGGLGLRDFWTQGQASCLALLIRGISEQQRKSFYLVKYLCGAQLASIRRSWAHLRDNYTSSAVSPSPFYAPLLTAIRDLHPPLNFFSEFYSSLVSKIATVPIFPYLWTPFVPRTFSLESHWHRVRDGVTENYKKIWLGSLPSGELKFGIHCATGAIFRAPDAHLAPERNLLTIAS